MLFSPVLSESQKLASFEKNIRRSLRSIKPKDIYNYTKQINLFLKILSKELRKNKDLEVAEIEKTLKTCFPGIPALILEIVLKETEILKNRLTDV